MSAKKKSDDAQNELAEKVEKSLRDMPKWSAGRTYITTRDMGTGLIISRHEIDIPEVRVVYKKK